MNRQQANEIRARMGLIPLPPVVGVQERKKRQAANQSAHAALQQAIKAKRNKGG